MQTSVQQVLGKAPSPRTQRFQQLRHMFSGMRKIENPHGILPMNIDHPLQPLSPIHHRTHLFRLDKMASACLDFRQIRKGRGITQAGEVGKLANMHRGCCVVDGPNLRNLSYGQSADLDPFSSDQRNHRTISTHDQAKGLGSGGSFFLVGKRGLGPLVLLHVLANLLTESAGRLRAHVNSQEIFENAAGMGKRHHTRQMDKVFLLSRGECSGK